MLELVLRLVFSLAVVVGMLLLLAKFSARRFRGSADALVRVVHRQPLSRGSAVAVVTVGSRVLVLGATEQQVQLITELEPEELDGLDGVADLDELNRLHGLDGLDRVEGAAASAAAPGASDVRPLTLLGGLSRAAQPAGKHAARTSGLRRVTGRPPARTAAALTAPDGALAGSVLSTQTWRQALTAATGKVERAS